MKIVKSYTRLNIGDNKITPIKKTEKPVNPPKQKTKIFKRKDSINILIE